MLQFIKENDFLKVDSFRENQDGTVAWTWSEGAGKPTHSGVIYNGLTRTDENETEIDIWQTMLTKEANSEIYIQWLSAEQREEIQAEIDAKAAAQQERLQKLDAFTFKGVSCSVCEADQNGWEVITARMTRLLDAGTAWRDIPFFMENGNHVILESEQEWHDFVEQGWQAREALMMARLTQ